VAGLGGLLIWGGAGARAQNVNDATTQQPSTTLFDGTSVNINDLMRAAELLDAQSEPPPNHGKNLDNAVEQFNQSRQTIKIGPSSVQATPSPNSPVSATDTAATPATPAILSPSPSPTP
jgi:hypothetical protein